MGSAMMIGVAHVIGMNPTFSSFFSIGPGFSCASALAASLDHGTEDGPTDGLLNSSFDHRLSTR